MIIWTAAEERLLRLGLDVDSDSENIEVEENTSRPRYMPTMPSFTRILLASEFDRGLVCLPNILCST